MTESLAILAEGKGKFLPIDSSGFRRWVRDHKRRDLSPRLMTEQEAIANLVADGDYLVYECDYLHRGPAGLIRELIRQGKKDLWIGGKFTYVDASLLAAAGAMSKVDVGFLMTGPTINRLIEEGKLQVFEYSNVVMTNRIMAGAMGIPFIPINSLGGTDGFTHSAAKLIADPYEGNPVNVVPALHPDVALIHAHQADIYGNARIFGTGISHVESAFASRKVIVTTEEIVDTEEIRSDPGRTTIPYYVVDAVVHMPYGAYPGEMQGVYSSDTPHVLEIFKATRSGDEESYLQKWVYGVENHNQMLDRLVGSGRLAEIRSRATIKEGYTR